ncbi:phosphonate ABC transporter, permease protein PhnE [Marininema halotolerans]|uniref:Phosphonate transport system permease protein n=1 Tax=Marininema halotolerans TaxID=1155944 RepID=A0A1I6UVY2_9BACL|nr:phosphonate ABC transporter, permease protein PhnE [Marininema halotolerans]SFT05581.1 phosphonate transport system permease protein [Marininema halotolerans]
MMTDSNRHIKRTKTGLTILILVLLCWGSAVRTDASLSSLMTGIPQMGDLLIEMVPPDWTFFSHIFDATLDTIRMALIGATLGAILAFPLALFSSSNLFPQFIVAPARFILNILRTIPDLLLASIFVAIFGLGIIPGILALAIFSMGIVAKLTYESIEAIDAGPLEAMTAVGANKTQWITFGVIPQIAAPFAAYFLYSFEINVRAAVVLGLVGAGGIGDWYNRTLNLLQYDKTSSIILLTLVVVILIDYVTTKVREQLL